MIVFFSTLAVPGLNSASLLFYLPVSSQSHKNVFRPLAHALATRGHQVTLVTTIRDPVGAVDNYREIVIVPEEEITTTLSKEAMRPKGNVITGSVDNSLQI